MSAPPKILVIDLGQKGRGPCNPARFNGLAPEVQVARLPVHDHKWQWFLDGLDALYVVEATYDDTLAQRCADAHVELVIHANPELWSEHYRGKTTKVVVPTRWEKKRVKGAQVMPVPVATDRLKFRQRTKAEVFLFPQAPAMQDRNGQRLLLQSLRYTNARFELMISPWHKDKRSRAGVVRIHYRPGSEDYWSVYDEADVPHPPPEVWGVLVADAGSRGVEVGDHHPRLGAVPRVRPPGSGWCGRRTRRMGYG